MKLYALCDQDILDENGVSLSTFIELAKEHNAEIIQYRNKNADIDFIKQQLIYIRQHYEGFLIINDVYKLVDICDGVHVGQEDLKLINKDISEAIKVLRNIVTKDKILGISTHNEEEVLEANSLDINYIGLGAYRETTTKKDISGVLGDSLDTIAKKSNHLVAAIGGVTLSDRFKNVTYSVIGRGLLQ